MKRSRLILSIAVLLLIGAVPTFAHAAEAEWDGEFQQKAKVRSDFTATLSFGGGIGSASGYPNELQKIDNAQYKASTGVAPMTSMDLWIGAALKDYFVLGLGFSQFGFSQNDLKASGFGFLFHLEGYPLYGRSRLENLALFAELGAGGINVSRETLRVAEGGAMSVVGLGAYYEFHAGHFGVGPALSYRHMFSTTLAAHTTTLAIRGTFYGGP